MSKSPSNCVADPASSRPPRQAEERKRRKALKAAAKTAKPLWEEDGKVGWEMAPGHLFVRWGATFGKP